MQIVRELAAEGNPVAKIVFLTRLAENTVREILDLQPEPAKRHRLPAEARREGFFPPEPNRHRKPLRIAA